MPETRRGKVAPGGVEHLRKAVGLWMTTRPSHRRELLRRDQRVEDQVASGNAASWRGRRRRQVEGVEVKEAALKRIEERRQRSDRMEHTTRLGG